MKGICLLLVGLAFWLPTHAVAGDTPPEVFYRAGHWQILGDGPHYLDLGVGLFDVLEEHAGRNSAAARLELRIGRKLWFVGPAVGVLANADGGWFGYGGIYADILYRHLVITPLLAVGGYDEGDGKDLGQTFQFRSSVEACWQFSNRVRLGLQLAHISNAGLNDRNPGEEDLLLTLGWPF